jgi:hypothetical protein
MLDGTSSSSLLLHAYGHPSFSYSSCHLFVSVFHYFFHSLHTARSDVCKWLIPGGLGHAGWHVVVQLASSMWSSDGPQLVISLTCECSHCYCYSFLRHTQTFVTGFFCVVRDMLDGTSSSSLLLRPIGHAAAPYSSNPLFVSGFIISFILLLLHAQTFESGFFQVVRGMLDGTSSSSLLRPCGHPMVPNSSYPSPVSVSICR